MDELDVADHFFRQISWENAMHIIIIVRGLAFSKHLIPRSPYSAPRQSSSTNNDWICIVHSLKFGVRKSRSSCGQFWANRPNRDHGSEHSGNQVVLRKSYGVTHINIMFVDGTLTEGKQQTNAPRVPVQISLGSGLS